MSPGSRNVAASVAARLLNQARRTGEDYQRLLTAYAFERLLYRLGVSDLRERFVLKGAMLLRLWSEQPYRATRDLDFLRRGQGSFAAIGNDLQTMCAVAVDPDGILFDTGTIRLHEIRAEDEYAGTRATLLARCGSARLPLQVDMGVGDDVWPRAEPCIYPTLLDFPAPHVLAYPREAVVAEKLEAIVVLGDRNSRIKDYFDLHHVASNFAVDRATLAEAVRRTFARRATPIPTEPPIGLTGAYWENPSRPPQIRAFVRRSGLTAPEEIGREFTELLGAFLLPVLEDLRRGAPRDGHWLPGGPWRTGKDVRTGGNASV